jgi:hypothetical protein
MNVNFGLNDYERLKYMLKMASQLKLKKREDMLLKKYPERKAQILEQIQKIQ